SVPDVRITDGLVLQGCLLALLSEDLVAAEGREGEPNDDLKPVREYLRGDGGTPDAVLRRRCQLAARLAHLYEEYDFSRSEMPTAWRGGSVLGAGPFAATERWQRSLWLAACGADGLLATRGRSQGVRWLMLPEAVKSVPPERLRLPDAVHVFGISYV